MSTAPKPAHGHMLREPGMGDLSYRGQGEWMILPIPRAWRTALEEMLKKAPGLADNEGIRPLMVCGVIEEDGSITGGEANVL